MRLNRNDIVSFTLTELMIVVIIVGIMAAFAVANYTRSIERSHRRDAETQLTNIWSAEQIYRAQYGQYWPSDEGSHLISEINSTLGLGIIPNGMTYSCTGVLTSNTFTCTAVRQPPAASFTIRVAQAQIDGTNPSCSSGSCP